jgi:hypothetical protein
MEKKEQLPLKVPETWIYFFHNQTMDITQASKYFIILIVEQRGEQII